MAIIHIDELTSQAPNMEKPVQDKAGIIHIDELIGKHDPTSVADGGLNYVKEHPFKTVFEPVAKTLTGKSLNDMAMESIDTSGKDFVAPDRPFDRNLPFVQPKIAAETFNKGVVADVADMATTPGSYIPIPLGKIAKPLARIKIRNTTVGDLATKLPINKDVVKNATKMIGEKDYTPILEKNAVAYRQLLNPSKGEIKNNEVKNRKDINDSFRLAAKEKLIVEESADKKLSTTKAREALKEKQDVLEEQLQGALATDKQPRFNLEDLKTTAKKNLRSQISNDADYLTAAKQVDDEIAAAVQERGQIVTGAELNKVKRGMWSKAYNQSAPTAHKAARQVGNAAKEMIQSGYDNADIKGINQELGKYLNLDTILENAHGRVVNRGKLGRYAAQIIGGVAGSKVPVFGPLAGTWVGGKVSDMIASPERVTGALAKKLKGMPETKFNFRVEPKKTPILGLPSPTKVGKDIPEYLKSRASTEAEGLGVKGFGKSTGWRKNMPIPQTKEPIALPQEKKFTARPEAFVDMSKGGTEKAKLRVIPRSKGISLKNNKGMISIGKDKLKIEYETGNYNDYGDPIVKRKNVQKYLYHSSPVENEESINNLGLKRKMSQNASSGNDGLYFTSDKSFNHAEAIQGMIGSKGSNLYRINTEKIRPNEIKIDGDFGGDPEDIAGFSYKIYKDFKPNEVEVSKNGGKTWEPLKSRVIPKNKGTIKKALGATAIAASLLSSNVQAAQPKDEDAILSIVGEVGPYGKEGMDWVAATIKNRNKGLQGVYGKNNPNVVGKKYTQKQYNDAKDAWEKAKKQDVTGGADHWFSDKDMQQDKVKNIIKEDKLIFIKKVGRNNFYKKPRKIKAKK